ncbi:MAG: hypothetical protein RIR62_2227, partial [Pseudomonadota bacterium]
VPPVATPPAPLAAGGAARPRDMTPPAPATGAQPVPRSARARPSALSHWLRENWVYAVAGISLALAGVFLVQYGMENGWLPPALRVLAALAFGLALVAGGEVIRRRHGDSPDAVTAYLPSVFAGAGIISVFAAILSARFLYGLIGGEATFAALVATGLGALVLGWVMGPLLAALGLAGAAAAPFLTGGGAEAPDWLVAHYALIAALGLGIDTLRRWGWVSVLALGLAFAGGALLLLAGLSQAAYALLVAGLVPLAIAIPARGLRPDQAGPSFVQVAQGQGKSVPFPLMLAAGTVLAASLVLLALSDSDGGTALLAFGLLAGLTLLLLLWPDRAPALHELALLPATAFLLRAVTEASEYGPLFSAFEAAALTLRPPETEAPLTLGILLALAGVMAVAFVLRARRGTLFHGLMTMAAAALPAALVTLAEVLWVPAATLGAFPWALHVIALAALMTALALAVARDEPAGARAGTAHLALSALVLVALALFVLTSAAALTLALSVLVVLAAALDRRFTLPEMGLAVQAGLAVIVYRLVADPGVPWGIGASLPAVLLSHLAPAVAAFVALGLVRPLPRPATRAALETGLVVAPALLADVLILRWLEGEGTYWQAVALGLPWLMVALGQLWRARPDLPLRQLRLVLAAMAALPAVAALLAALTVLNPLISADPVIGPPVLNTLALAYALPAALLLAARGRIPWLPPKGRAVLLGAGVGMLAVYAVLAIRHIWQGPDLSRAGTTQAELYSYTVALIALGGGLLWQGIARRSIALRRAAMAVIGLAVAKVFLVDAAGLAGLMRVFSFLALGLSLAGLAWLNRWAGQRAGASGPQAPPPL